MMTDIISNKALSREATGCEADRGLHPVDCRLIFCLEVGLGPLWVDYISFSAVWSPHSLLACEVSHD